MVTEDELTRSARIALNRWAARYERLEAEAQRLREALEAIEAMTGAAGAGEIPALPVARRARKALNG